MPDGFKLQVYSTDVPLARFMAATPAGDLIVTRTRADIVSILERDRDGDGRADGHRVLLEGLQGPHGVALHDGWLYLAERTAIGRAPFDVETGTITGPYSHILTGLTTDGFHQTKTIAFGPDGWLYLSQGSTCNVCVEKDPRRATIMRMRPDGSERRDLRDRPAQQRRLRLGAVGRRAVRDRERARPARRRFPAGRTEPRSRPEASTAGRISTAMTSPDPEFGSQYAGAHEPAVARARLPAAQRAARHPLPARGQLPAGYERTALVALHGSWNRSTPDGYKVVALAGSRTGASSSRIS